MSSARTRRLTDEAVTGRFAWQGQPSGGPVVQPLMPGASAASANAATVRDLGALVAERHQAAEREAFAKGHAKGEAAGQAAAAARIDATVRRLTTTIEEVASLRSGVLRRTEQDIVRLAVALAERILHREVTVDRDVVLSIAQTAAARLGDQAVATIHLNPADLEAIKHRASVPPGRVVTLVADANVAPGGSIVRSAIGTIDASIEAQVREIARALLGDAAGEHEADGSGTGS